MLVTLILIMIGLSAHLLPGASLCTCVSKTSEGPRASNFDLCLVCQLQTGIHASSRLADLTPEITPRISTMLTSRILEHASSVLHPPIA